MYKIRETQFDSICRWVTFGLKNVRKETQVSARNLSVPLAGNHRSRTKAMNSDSLTKRKRDAAETGELLNLWELAQILQTVLNSGGRNNRKFSLRTSLFERRIEHFLPKGITIDNRPIRGKDHQHELARTQTLKERFIERRIVEFAPVTFLIATQTGSYNKIEAKMLQHFCHYEAEKKGTARRTSRCCRYSCAGEPVRPDVNRGHPVGIHFCCVVVSDEPGGDMHLPASWRSHSCLRHMR
jgi:hypothetical protein